MKLGRVLFLVALIGVCGGVARASVTAPKADARVIFNTPDPTCAPGYYCVDLTYTGPTESYPDLIFSVSNPPGELSDPSSYVCTTNVFATCSNITNAPPTELYGFLLDGGDPTITHGQTFSLSSSGPIDLTIPTGSDGMQIFSCGPGSDCKNGVAELSPEPGTAILFMSGLISLLGFGRKRLAAAFLA
jgi:hypothetical protein